MFLGRRFKLYLILKNLEKSFFFLFFLIGQERGGEGWYLSGHWPLRIRVFLDTLPWQNQPWKKSCSRGFNVRGKWPNYMPLFSGQSEHDWSPPGFFRGCSQEEEGKEIRIKHVQKNKNMTALYQNWFGLFCFLRLLLDGRISFSFSIPTVQL